MGKEILLAKENLNTIFIVIINIILKGLRAVLVLQNYGKSFHIGKMS